MTHVISFMCSMDSGRFAKIYFHKPLKLTPDVCCLRFVAVPVKRMEQGAKRASRGAEPMIIARAFAVAHVRLRWITDILPRELTAFRRNGYCIWANNEIWTMLTSDDMPA